MTTITRATPTPSRTAVKRHPIRGALWGALFGIGLALFLIGMKWIVVGTVMPFVVFAGGVVLGALWGAFGPAKHPMGPPPTHPSVETRSDVVSPPLPPLPEVPLRADVSAAGSTDLPAEPAPPVETTPPTS